MKLFSRKAIVAGATALAVTFAGTSVAVAEDETPAVSSSSETSTTSTPVNDKEDAGSSSDPKDITAWISVFTAVIGALGTLFTFANKHFDFMR